MDIGLGDDRLCEGPVRGSFRDKSCAEGPHHYPTMFLTKRKSERVDKGCGGTTGRGSVMYVRATTIYEVSNGNL